MGFCDLMRTRRVLLSGEYRRIGRSDVPENRSTNACILFLIWAACLTILQKTINDEYCEFTPWRSLWKLFRLLPLKFCKGAGSVTEKLWGGAGRSSSKCGMIVCRVEVKISSRLCEGPRWLFCFWGFWDALLSRSILGRQDERPSNIRQEGSAVRKFIWQLMALVYFWLWFLQKYRKILFPIYSIDWVCIVWRNCPSMCVFLLRSKVAYTWLQKERDFSPLRWNHTPVFLTQPLHF